MPPPRLATRAGLTSSCELRGRCSRCCQVRAASTVVAAAGSFWLTLQVLACRPTFQPADLGALHVESPTRKTHQSAVTCTQHLPLLLMPTLRLVQITIAIARLRFCASPLRTYILLATKLHRHQEIQEVKENESNPFGTGQCSMRW